LKGERVGWDEEISTEIPPISRLLPQTRQNLLCRRSTGTSRLTDIKGTRTGRRPRKERCQECAWPTVVQARFLSDSFTGQLACSAGRRLRFQNASWREIGKSQDGAAGWDSGPNRYKGVVERRPFSGRVSARGEFCR